MPEDGVIFKKAKARIIGNVVLDEVINLQAPAQPAQMEWGNWGPGAEMVKPPKVEPLEDVDLTGAVARGEATPDFHIAYESAPEADLRLRHTFIAYKGQPAYVDGVIPVNIKKTSLSLSFANGAQAIVDLTDSGLSFRSFAPGYLDMSKAIGKPYTAAYLVRHPGRVFQQGMNNLNTRVIDINTGEIYGIGDIERRKFMAAFASRKKLTPFTIDQFAKLQDTSIKNDIQCSQVLSTNFAYTVWGRGGILFYRMCKVGTVDKDGINGINPRTRRLFESELCQLNLI